ncbi:MAG: ribosome recycling factor [bacterium]
MFEQKVFFDDLSERFEKSIESYKGEISQYRTGKASPKLLDSISVDYYGTKTPLHQMATIITPDPRLILVQPYDRSSLKEIENAIRNANLGFNPINDGVGIKVPVPPLTEERRKDLVKQLNQLTEKYRISMRNLRRDALVEIKKAEKDKMITEDEEKKFSDKVQQELNDFIKKLDEIAKFKENDIIEL